MDNWRRICERQGELLEELPHYDRLARIIAEEEIQSMPNLLIHGPPGAPLDAIWEEGLRRRFLAPGERFHRTERMWERELVYHETPYFFEIDLASPFQPKDLSKLRAFVKAFVEHPSIHTPRHIFVIRNVHRASMRENRYAFRVLLERFSANVWFVCTSYHLASMDPPLRSRFWNMRAPLPSPDEVRAICARMEIPWHPECEGVRNLALLCLYADLPPSKRSPRFFMRAPPIAAFLEQHPSPTIDQLRTFAYQLVAHSTRVSDTAADLIELIPLDRRHRFLRTAAEAEHMCAGTARTREVLYHELLLHAALYG